VTGGYVALALALQELIDAEAIPAGALLEPVAAVSVGLVDGRPLLDLDYGEDSTAEADFNVVMTRDDRIVEVQGTAEGVPFAREALEDLLDLARQGIEQLSAIQQRVLRRAAGGAR
jgi:ribonuclease PH